MKHGIGFNFQQDAGARGRGRAKHTGAAARAGVRMGLLVNLMPGEAMGAGREGSHSQARATAGLMSSPAQAAPPKKQEPPSKCMENPTRSNGSALKPSQVSSLNRGFDNRTESRESVCFRRTEAPREAEDQTLL